MGAVDGSTPVSSEPDLLLFAEACKELRISASAGYRAVKAGTFPVPVLRPTPRKMLVSRVMLERYIATGVSVTEGSRNGDSG